MANEFLEDAVLELRRKLDERELRKWCVWQAAPHTPPGQIVEIAEQFLEFIMRGE